MASVVNSLRRWLREVAGEPGPDEASATLKRYAEQQPVTLSGDHRAARGAEGTVAGHGPDESGRDHLRSRGPNPGRLQGGVVRVLGQYLLRMMQQAV